MAAAIKAVLLDMDGTLFDSESFYKSLWQDTAREFGIILTDKAYQRFIGAHFEQCKGYIQELGGANFALDDFLTVMAEREESSPVPPMKPGAVALLQWLRQQNMTTALVTSSPLDMVERYFEPLGGTAIFDLVISGDHVSNFKPHPEPYQMACDELGLHPVQTLAVEDSNNGARSALAAGCPTIVIADILPIETDVKSRATACFESLSELPDWIHWYNRHHSSGPACYK